MKPWLSTMPVAGDSSALVQCRLGSSASASARVSTRMPSTPLISARRLMSDRRESSSALVATMSLPQLAWGTPFSAQ